MATYAIGDIQGCFKELTALLHHIRYRPSQDTLWFTGDLVNRGPQSLEVLQFLSMNPGPMQVVLGNHDMHLLRIFYANKAPSQNDTLNAVLDSKEASQLMAWLIQHPLIHYDALRQTVLVHAGIWPSWSIEDASIYANEVHEALLDKTRRVDLLENMYGNHPNSWSPELINTDRLRFIINACTRMRFCKADASLDFSNKGIETPANLYPWFQMPGRRASDTKILFGHWAALQGKANTPNVEALDTGCVWGGALTALCLETGQRFSVAAK